MPTEIVPIETDQPNVHEPESEKSTDDTPTETDSKCKDCNKPVIVVTNKITKQVPCPMVQPHSVKHTHHRNSYNKISKQPDRLVFSYEENQIIPNFWTKINAFAEPILDHINKSLHPELH